MDWMRVAVELTKEQITFGMELERHNGGRYISCPSSIDRRTESVGRCSRRTRMGCRMTVTADSPLWPDHVKAPFERLLEAERAEYSDAESALRVIDLIEQAERDVMIAWAECTTGWNPGMLESVLSGMLPLSRHGRKHIAEALGWTLE